MPLHHSLDLCVNVFGLALLFTFLWGAARGARRHLRRRLRR